MHRFGQLAGQCPFKFGRSSSQAQAETLKQAGRPVFKAGS
jgi:hypothetical protein